MVVAGDAGASTGTSSSSGGTSSRSRSRSARSGAPAGDGDAAAHFPWSRGAVLGRYEVLELLGEGTFGRVLLAQDTQDGRRVAVKVVRDVKRDRQNARVEADLLTHIRQADPEGLRGCCILHEAFVHEGRFFCLVCEPLGMSLYAALKQNAYRGFWLQDVQSFASQCLGALAFLHRGLRITHADLKPENVLLQSAEALRPSHFPRQAFWQDLQGLSSPPASQYVRPADRRVKLVDFGNAIYEHDYHPATINTRQYRGPEVLLDCGWDELSDVWSLGCVLMELYTGDVLFNTHEDIHHLALMERILEQLPASVLGQAGQAARESYLLCDGGPDSSAWRLRWPEGASSASLERHVHNQRPLPLLVSRHHRLFATFALWLLSVDRRDRPSAMEASKHPFLTAPFDD